MADIKIGTSAINKFYMGSTAVDKLYLGTTEIWAAVVPDIELNWIENTNRAATFTTALNSNNTTYSEVKVQFKEALYSNSPFIGGQGYNNSSAQNNQYTGYITYAQILQGTSRKCIIAIRGGTKTVYSGGSYDYYNLQCENLSADKNINTGITYTISRNDAAFRLNGATMSAYKSENGVNIYDDYAKTTLTSWKIFSNGTGVPRFKFYYLKTWSNDSLTTLQHHYVPVRHWDGSKYVVCIKDKVTNTYIYQSGSGTLTYG